MHAFDRQTDGQTERRIDTFLVASPRWHYMQREKNSATQKTKQCNAEIQQPKTLKKLQTVSLVNI